MSQTSLFADVAKAEGLSMPGRPSVWSCGGGTQSAAIAALIVSGRLPKPDISLIVDTEREKSSTWEYLDGVLRPALASVGVDIVRVPKSEYATVDLYRGDTILLPMFTEKGKMSTFCSNEWKRRVAKRFLSELGVRRCVNWLGISADEPRRIRVSQ